MSLLRRALPVGSLIGTGLAWAFAWQLGPGRFWPVLLVPAVLFSALSLLVLWREELLLDHFRYQPGDPSWAVSVALLSTAALGGLGWLALRIAPRTVARELFEALIVRAALPTDALRALAVVLLATATITLWLGAVAQVFEGALGTRRAVLSAGALALLASAASLRLSVIGTVAVALLGSIALRLRARTLVPAILSAAMTGWLALELLVPQLLQWLQQRAAAP